MRIQLSLWSLHLNVLLLQDWMGELEAESELKETIRTRVKDLETASRELAGVVTTYLRISVGWRLCDSLIVKASPNHSEILLEYGTSEVKKLPHLKTCSHPSEDTSHLGVRRSARGCQTVRPILSSQDQRTVRSLSRSSPSRTVLQASTLVRGTM